MGDVYALMKRKPKIIAIIDGLFERTPAVWHKEILYAISQGVRVLGSSSMGALRAAELCEFGMEGVGQVFEAYRDGILEDDDEVAVIHAPAEFGYRPLSEAMVNIREGLTCAEALGLITPTTSRTLQSAAKKMFYPDRSWSNLMEVGQVLRVPTDELIALSHFVKREGPDVKRRDAIELLQRISNCRESQTPTRTPNFEFEPTVSWKKLVKMIDGAI